ncbi:uncharacterized protein LTR77_005416 [Saxophila tyrrhenica]|uniref:Uncharacterized protein n=1 Tax=Saxophila tyrrhenica TaxID=1690608 RepID=A0AAV9P914_9PEZI|nr:hypothetical protein LTR77_005416 [Saxophila tyrrhenica]
MPRSGHRNRPGQDILRVEKKLGFKWEWGISRVSWDNFELPELRLLMKELEILKGRYRTSFPAQLVDMPELRRDANEVFETIGPAIWPRSGRGTSDWLVVPSANSWAGLFPRYLEFDDPDDYQTLSDLFKQLVYLKCYRYHGSEKAKAAWNDFIGEAPENSEMDDDTDHTGGEEGDEGGGDDNMVVVAHGYNSDDGDDEEYYDEVKNEPYSVIATRSGYPYRRPYTSTASSSRTTQAAKGSARMISSTLMRQRVPPVPQMLAQSDFDEASSPAPESSQHVENDMYYPTGQDSAVSGHRDRPIQYSARVSSHDSDAATHSTTSAAPATASTAPTWTHSGGKRTTSSSGGSGSGRASKTPKRSDLGVQCGVVTLKVPRDKLARIITGASNHHASPSEHSVSDYSSGPSSVPAPCDAQSNSRIVIDLTADSGDEELPPLPPYQGKGKGRMIDQKMAGNNEHFLQGGRLPLERRSSAGPGNGDADIAMKMEVEQDSTFAPDLADTVH